MPRLYAARNVAKAFLLLGGLAAVLAAFGWWLGGFRLASVFLAVALLMVSIIYWYGPRIILTSLGARELTVGESPLLATSIERLAAAAGLRRPKLYLLPDGYPRALVVGRGAGDFGIAVSQGFLSVAAPAEIEGVLAQGLAQAKHRDVVIQTPVVLLALWLVEASRIGGFLERALLFVLAPLAAGIVHVTLSPKRVAAADTRAAAICGTPHGLADALLRLEQTMELVSFRGSPVIEPLYLVNPFGDDRLSVMFRTHPPIGDRVRRLRDLDSDWRETLRAA